MTASVLGGRLAVLVFLSCFPCIDLTIENKHGKFSQVKVMNGKNASSVSNHDWLS
jgi:hypothetical protein